jgi:Flp pilus assembly protein TadD
MLAACDRPAGLSSDTGRLSPGVGNAALAEGESDMALHVANFVLEKDPGNVQAMITRANALYATGDMAGADTAYRAATTSDPSSVIAWLGLGRVLLRSDPHAAALAFQTVVARAPDNAVGWNNLGIAHDLEGQHDEAQIAYRRSLALAPGAEDVQANLGLSLALSGHAPEAVALLRPLATRPGAPQIWRDDFEVARAAARDDAAATISASPKAAEALAEMSETSRPPGMAVAAAPAPEATAADTPAPSTGLPASEAAYVQLAALDSEAQARSAWRQLLARMPRLIGRHTPTIVTAEVRGRVFWRLRTGGFANIDEARRFCTQVRALGWSHGCWVP